MKALLLAAGRGVRLKPVSDKLPKCLMPVRGIPLIEYWLASLRHAGINSVLINLHYKADMVRRYLEQRPGDMDITMVYEPELLNTGGTLLANKEYFGDERVMLIHADNLCLVDLNQFIESHEQRPPQAAITMMTYVTDTPASCGIVLTDERGLVREFHEKVQHPPGNTANAAVYILEPEVIGYLVSLGKVKIDFSRDIIPPYIGCIYSFLNNVYHRDIGTMESLEKAQHFKPANLDWLPEHHDKKTHLLERIDELSLRLGQE